MKRICIFGATGNVGTKAVEIGLKKGLTVSVFVRDSGLIPDDIKSQITIFEGNVLNLSDVTEAVKDQDGIIVTLGTRHDLGPTTVMSEGIANITNAMKTHGVDKVAVCISAFLFLDSEKIPERFQNVSDDHRRMYDILKNTDLNWIAVFPPHFTDNESSNFVVEHEKNPGRSITKIDLAKFLLESLNTPEHYKKVCGIANK